jgi:transcriptional regulator with XRE-family HTH domain
LTYENLFSRLHLVRKHLRLRRNPETTMPRSPAIYLLRADHVRDFIDGLHQTQSWAARHLGLSRSYWSQLMNGRRPLSPSVRRLLLSSPHFGKLGEDALWERRAANAEPAPRSDAA